MGVGWAHIGHQEVGGFPDSVTLQNSQNARALQET